MTSDRPPTEGSQALPEPPSEPPSAGPPGSTGHGSDDFFNRIRSAGVTRPDEGRWAAGVAAGLARRWDVDPILVRGIFVALGIAGGIGFVLYGLAWLLLPQDDGRIHLQQAIRGDFTVGFVGALILSLVSIGGGGGSGPWHDGFWLGWAFPGGLIITAAAVFAIWWFASQEQKDGRSDPGSTPEAGSAVGPPAQGVPPVPPVYGSPSTSPAYPVTTAPPRTWATADSSAGQQAALKARRARTRPSKAIVRLTLGIALLTAAAILVIGNASDWSAPVGVIAAATALAVIAGGVIASGLNGRRASGLVWIGILLALGTLAGAGADNAGIQTGQNVTIVGQPVWQPHTRAAAESQFNLGAGEATLWLTDPDLLSASTPDPLRVQARVGVGHLTVIVPDATSTQFDLVVGAVEVSYPDGTSHRFNQPNEKSSDRQRLTTGPAGPARLIVDVQLGAGQLDLRTTSGTSVTTIPDPTPSSSSTPGATSTPTAPATT